MPVPATIESATERAAAALDLFAKSPLSSPTEPGWDVFHVAPFGSFGDEALALGSQEAAHRAGCSIRVRVPGSATPWTEAGIEQAESLDGFLVPNLLRRAWRVSVTLNREGVAFIGADTIGGDYGVRYLGFRTRIMNAAARAGRQVRLFNVSIGERTSGSARRLLRSIDPRVEILARDIESQRRLATILGRDIGIAPDVAVLMTARATQASQSAVGGGPPAILTPNAHLHRLFGEDESTQVEAWAKLAVHLASDSPVLLVPHDVRDSPGDVELSRKIASRASSLGVPVPVFVPRSAREAKAVIQDASILVSARMHACVAGLSSGIPTVGLEYLGKFVGQFDWFDQAQWVQPASVLLDTAELAGLVRRARAARSDATELVRSAQDRAATVLAQRGESRPVGSGAE